MEAPESSTPDVPPFAAAVSRLQEFIGNRDFLRPPVWVFREDVACLKWRIFVRTPLPKQNSTRAEIAYEAARSRGLGVVLHVLCVLDFEPCCYVWWPKDNVDAEHAMLSGLKLAIPHPLLVGNSVRNSTVWWYRRWQERRSGFTSYIDCVPNRDC